MTVLVISEGTRDIGDSSEERQGAVKVLVQRLLSREWGRDVDLWEIETDVLKRFHRGNGYARKVQMAITEARVKKCKALVIVVDRDGPKNTRRLSELREGRALEEQRGEEMAKKTVLGVAVETVEAWLLADIKALNKGLQLSPPQNAIQDPEQLFDSPRGANHPKTIFENLFRQATSPGDPYSTVAGWIDLTVLEQRCPEGFGPLVDELRERLGSRRE